MSEPIITVEKLSKSYLVGHQSDARSRYVTLRDVIAKKAREFVRKAADWSMDDKSFRVMRSKSFGR